MLALQVETFLAFKLNHSTNQQVTGNCYIFIYSVTINGIYFTVFSMV